MILTGPRYHSEMLVLGNDSSRSTKETMPSGQVQRCLSLLMSMAIPLELSLKSYTNRQPSSPNK